MQMCTPVTFFYVKLFAVFSTYFMKDQLLKHEQNVYEILEMY